MPFTTDRLAQRILTVLLLLGLAVTAAAQEETSEYAQRFDFAWQLVNDRYWDLDAVGVDWEAVGERYRPQALAASSDEEFYETVSRMYEELGDDHSTFVAPSQVEEIHAEYGALPCLPVFSAFSLPTHAQASFETLPSGVQYRTYDEIGYLKLPDLASNGVTRDVREAVQELTEAGSQALILDLRGNPGGRLVEMMQVAGVFTGGFLWRVVTSWSFPLPYPAIGATATDLPLVVLTDSNVHSAAEGLAGALQARGRAITIGETTAGNVEAVLPFCLADGSQAWIATGVLAPVGGPTWEGQGVEPDIPAAADDALESALEYLREG